MHEPRREAGPGCEGAEVGRHIGHPALELHRSRPAAHQRAARRAALAPCARHSRAIAPRTPAGRPVARVVAVGADGRGEDIERRVRRRQRRIACARAHMCGHVERLVGLRVPGARSTADTNVICHGCCHTGVAGHPLWGAVALARVTRHARCDSLVPVVAPAPGTAPLCPCAAKGARPTETTAAKAASAGRSCQRGLLWCYGRRLTTASQGSRSKLRTASCDFDGGARGAPRRVNGPVAAPAARKPLVRTRGADWPRRAAELGAAWSRAGALSFPGSTATQWQQV